MSVARAADERAMHADLMLAVAQELSALNAMCMTLQDVVAGKVRTGALTGGALVEAQAADAVAQQVAELEKFLRVYVDALETFAEDPLGRALSGVSLTALGRRLAPDRAAPQGSESATSPGDLDLF
jgi:lactam utilization protein B